MSRIDEIAKELRELESELREHLGKRGEFDLKNGKIRFSKEQFKAHKRYAKGLLAYLRDAPLGNILSSPVIYMQVVPVALLDIFVSIYQGVCFPIYGIKKVRRKEHVIIDRHKLKYLNTIERINCLYCGYFNGVISYVREVGARTELYWCPIKHTKTGEGMHPYYPEFIDYGDYEALHEKWRSKRAELLEESVKSGEA